MSKTEAPNLVQTNPIQFFHVNFKILVFCVVACVVSSLVGAVVVCVMDSLVVLREGCAILRVTCTAQSEIQTCP